MGIEEAELRRKSLPGDSPTQCVAIVGCGAVVEKIHAPALAYLAHRGLVRVVAAVDPDSKRAALIAARFPGCVAAEAITSLPENVDLALVASPVTLHASHCSELLTKGVNVLCEKPMASTSAECAAMIEAAEQANRLLAVGQIRRFYPVSRQIRDLVAGGALGRVRSYRILEGSRYQWHTVTDASFRKQAAGGILRDVGVHVLDLALWWFGEPLTIAYRDDAMGGVEANARISLTYPDGVAGEIRLSRDALFRERAFIQFERGWVAFKPNNPIHLEIGVSPDWALDATVHEQIVTGAGPAPGPEGATFQQAFIHQLLNVTRATAGLEPLFVPGEEAAKAIRLIESCYGARQLMEMAWMSEAELTAARATQ